MKQSKLNEMIRLHGLWLKGDRRGKRANLENADLSNLCLKDANLRSANLTSVFCYRTNFVDADLRGANLQGGEFNYCTFEGANLAGANCQCLKVCVCDFLNANFKNTNFSNTFFIDSPVPKSALANSQRVHMMSERYACPNTGTFIGYKKARRNRIVMLEIPATAKRSSAHGPKCRCSEATVLDIQNIWGTRHYKTARSIWDPKFIYKVGETVYAHEFNEDRWRECAPGIHFFMDRAEACKYHFR